MIWIDNAVQIVLSFFIGVGGFILYFGGLVALTALIFFFMKLGGEWLEKVTRP